MRDPYESYRPIASLGGEQLVMHGIDDIALGKVSIV